MFAVRSVEHVARIGNIRVYSNVCSKQEEVNHLEELGLNGRRVLKFFLS